MMYIYCLKNNKLGYYNPPTFSNMDPESTKVTLERTCKQDPKKYQEYHYDECALYFLGNFDEVTGQMSVLPDYKFLCDLAPCFHDYVVSCEKENMAMYSQIAYQLAGLIKDKGGLNNGN